MNFDIFDMPTMNLQQTSRDDYSAIVTVNQFKALGSYSNCCFQDEEMYRKYMESVKKRDVNKIKLSEVKSQLVNSWNTEKLLRYTAQNFTTNSDGFVIQWVFPQAYYSIFNSTLAFFETVGHSERSHVAVRAKVADLAHSGKYPEKLCVWSDGVKNNMTVEGLACSKEGFEPLLYLPDDDNNVKCHIHSFMRTTRQIYLDKKREDLNGKFKTKQGGNKKQLTFADWNKVSEALKKTSWLCLLYRKRIKANYQDIDTFLSNEFQVSEVINAIVSLVNVLNFVNEINIYKSIGEEMEGWIGNRYQFVSDRVEKIQSLSAQ
jgi:hypothetical protein